jgi:uncharacterized protein (DUF1330 family)
MTMPKAYLISAYQEINNQDALAAYAKLAAPVLIAAGGKFLARGMPSAVKESGKLQRTVLIEFENLQAALDAYESEAYQLAMKELKNNAVVRDIRIVEGA